MLFCNVTPVDGRFVNAIVFCRESEFCEYLFTPSTFNLCTTIWISLVLHESFFCSYNKTFRQSIRFEDIRQFPLHELWQTTL